MQASRSLIQRVLWLWMCLVPVGAARAEGMPETTGKPSPVLQQEPTPKKRVYAYTDDRGRLVYAERLEQVPVQLQKYARQVDAPSGMFDEGHDEELGADLFSFDGQKKRDGRATIYRITAKDGSVVYTNLVERVPPEQRAAAKVDLSHVSLGTQLGNELDARIKQEHARLIGSKYCQDLRAELALPPAERMWHEQRPLIVCLGIVLLLLIITPSMVRKVGGPEWGRTLAMAVPALAIAGGAMYGMVKANNMLAELDAKAKPCRAETWDKLAAEPATGLTDHLTLVQQLQDQISQLDSLSRQSR